MDLQTRGGNPVSSPNASPPDDFRAYSPQTADYHRLQPDTKQTAQSLAEPAASRRRCRPGPTGGGGNLGWWRRSAPAVVGAGRCGNVGPASSLPTFDSADQRCSARSPQRLLRLNRMQRFQLASAETPRVRPPTTSEPDATREIGATPFQSAVETAAPVGLCAVCPR
jgi:hypothetical protein